MIIHVVITSIKESSSSFGKWNVCAEEGESSLERKIHLLFERNQVCMTCINRFADRSFLSSSCI
jgi:hypothetical protein